MFDLKEELGLINVEDKKHYEDFVAKRKLMEEHPIMREQCLGSMCLAYAQTKDKIVKMKLLGDLYEIRKGRETNKEKREMAKLFGHVLEQHPELKQDENLVALSKVDIAFVRPTQKVEKRTL